MPRPVKHSFTIGGHRTSISLEREFWDTLREIAAHEGRPVAAIVQQIDEQRVDGSGLSSAVRIWILRYYKSPK